MQEKNNFPKKSIGEKKDSSCKCIMKDIKAVYYNEVGGICNDDMHTTPRIVTENYFSIFAADTFLRH